MFLSLNEYAARQNIVRQTASDRLARGDVAHLKLANKYYIPDSADYMKTLLFERQELINNGNEKLKTIVVSIINHKGGVGKTIAVANIAASLAFFGYKVLIVDCDPQSNTSNIGRMKRRYNNFKDSNILKLLNELDSFRDDEHTREAVLSSIINVDSIDFCYGDGRLDLLPNSIDWAGHVEPLLFKPNSANYLDMLLTPIKDQYDFIFVDTAPSLDVLWRQAVIASDVLLIASKLEEDSVDGLIGVCRETYKLNAAYRDRKKKNLEILGVVVVDYQNNANFSKQQEPDLLKIMGSDLIYNKEPGIIFEPKISKTVKAAEIQHLRRVALLDAPTSNLSDEFLQLTANLVYNIYRTRGV
jgi:chromosome partitioning protein